MVEYIKRYDAMKICQEHSTHCFSVSDAKGQDIADKIEDEIAEIPTADVVEVRDCNLCIYNSRHATEYPCSHCKNCYTDKFKPYEERRDT